MIFMVGLIHLCHDTESCDDIPCTLKFLGMFRKRNEMKIWVDADACPVVIKEIIFRAAERTQTRTILVANRMMSLPASPWLTRLIVSEGLDAADNEIIKQLSAGDLVITSDIPLAAEVIEKKGQALSPRGELFSIDNVRSRLNVRDFMETMRASGIHTGGPAPLNQRDRQAFANHLDRILLKRPDAC